MLPLPEELPLLGAGYAAHVGRASFWGCLGAAWLAVFVGDVATFQVGRLFERLMGVRLVRRVFTPARRRWAEGLVSRHGWRAIAIGRFLVGLRGFVFVAVGASGFPLSRFAPIDAAVALAEVSLLVGAGFLFGHLRAHAGTWMNVVVAAVLCLVLLVPVAIQRSRDRETRRGEKGQLPAP